mmetsp:Transcript_74066/g.154467  ORF Transcript_74066/g.154467 Transcript_74066/m.154467 type:complete len:88 (+) Transcript_74066:540-803(+)
MLSSSERLWIVMALAYSSISLWRQRLVQKRKDGRTTDWPHQPFGTGTATSESQLEGHLRGWVEQTLLELMLLLNMPDVVQSLFDGHV